VIANIFRRLAFVERHQRPEWGNLVARTRAQIGGQRHDRKALLCLNRIGQIGRAIGKNTHDRDADLGAASDLNHVARDITGKSRACDDVHARLRACACSKWGNAEQA